MDEIKLLVISWKGCPPCEAMRKAKTVDRFRESYEDVAVEHHTLPSDWPDVSDDMGAAARLKLLASWSEAERAAIKMADKYEMEGAPFVAFVDGKGAVLVESDGAVNLTQLKDLYQEALEVAGGEGSDDDEGSPT